MKALLVLIDGLGDDPIACWQDRTPWEQALRPCMSRIASLGKESRISICEHDLVPESCSCILRLLGVAGEDMPANRAYLELLAHGGDISSDELVMRCNLVTVDASGKMTAFNGAGLTNQAMRQAAAYCGGICDSVSFEHLSEYRNLLILPREEQLLEVNIPPPHENVGESYAELLGELRLRSSGLAAFLDKAAEELRPFAHAGVEYRLYPWGVSSKDALPSFSSIHGLCGAVVCRTEIVQGIGKALGMKVETPEGTTGDIDTDIGKKADAAIKLLDEYDFVLAHFNGSDEAAHRRDFEAKSRFIEAVDREFVCRVIQEFAEPLRIVICGDHVTSSVTGRHGAGRVPVLAGSINGDVDIKSMESYRDITNFLYVGV